MQKRDEWIAKHVAFRLRDNFDYRGKIKSLTDLNTLKKLYAVERKSDSEIDNIAKTFEETFDKVVATDDYNLILRHLDYKGLISQFGHILKFKEEVKYEEAIF